MGGGGWKKESLQNKEKNEVGDQTGMTETLKSCTTPVPRLFREYCILMPGYLSDPRGTPAILLPRGLRSLNHPSP